MPLMICRGHNRVSKGALKFFFAIDSPMVKLTPKLDFSLLSSFGVWFERVVNRLGGQNWYQRSVYTWSMQNQCENRKNYLRPDSSKLDVLFWASKTTLCGIRHPSSCIPTLVHMSALVGLKTGIYRAAASHCETKHMLYWLSYAGSTSSGQVNFWVFKCQLSKCQKSYSFSTAMGIFR